MPVLAQGNPGDSVFNTLQVHTVNFVFSQAWTTVDAQLKSNKEAEINIPARLEINCIPVDNPRCVTFDSVGVRYKGNSTFSTNSQKNPFRIDFDAYGIDQRWNGTKGFILNNANSDASYMREKIHTDFANRAGMVSPRFSYAQVYVNGAIHSFYLMGELVDGPFLKTRLGENDGDLFKAVDGIGAGGMQFSDFQRKSPFATAAYQTYYENKSDSAARAWARLVTLIDTLNLATAQRLPDALTSRVNLNGLYRALGADILFANWDAYIQSGRNFQFYFPEAPGGRMEWILWDMSLSFGAYGGGGGGGGGGGTSTTPGAACSGTTAANIVCGGSTRPMANKVMTSQTLREDYLRALWFMYNAYFSDGWLSARIDSVQTLIASSVTADTKSRTTNIATAFAPGVTTLKTFVNSRITSVNSQFTTHGITAANAIRGGDVIINEVAPVQGWVEVYNNRAYSIDLSGHSLTNDVAQPAKWTFPLRSFVAPGGYLVVRLQGGSLGTAGPVNFGFTASAGGQLRLNRANGSVVDSVIFGAHSGDTTVARLGGAQTFGAGFPTPGAANIASSAGTSSLAPLAVTINEFMADNDTIVSPAGVKADWIELYNNTSSPLNLGGLNLSDNPNNPAKWQFPAGTTIPANGYLVVWAYDTVVTGALYARWALSKDGEHIRLSNADLSVIDSVTFGAQVKSRTMARIPNGIGAFSSACASTLGGANTCLVVALQAARPLDRASFALAGASGRLSAQFSLATTSRVRLSVHDARGREVAVLLNESLAPGTHVRALDASSLPAGLYWFRLRAGSLEYTRAGVTTR